MIKAEAMLKIEAAKVGYWRGYIRGLRRAHHGEKFGLEAEHQFYMSLITDSDADRRQIGKGYREGLAALK